jgi:DNA modification methylase
VKDKQHTLKHQLISEFLDLTGLRLSLDGEYEQCVDQFLTYVAQRKFQQKAKRKQIFLGRVNAKFRLNAEHLAKFYAAAAQRGLIFNYNEKRLLQHAFDTCDHTAFDQVLTEAKTPAADVAIYHALFTPIDPDASIAHLKQECSVPSKLRVEKGDRDIAKDIGQAMFAAYLWTLLPDKELHAYFDPTLLKFPYEADFWQHLRLTQPELFQRNHALHILRINQPLIQHLTSLDSLRDAICDHVSSAYRQINNYGYLAVVIEPLADKSGRPIEWECAADIMLYAEKHIATELKKPFFRWQQIQANTTSHVPLLNTSKARFHFANEGFTYRDCFVLHDSHSCIRRILLLLQKNQRDETLIPCPSCRTHNVQGNSYSSLGVKSWECNNPLCCDRTKYNRGKRYSMRSLLMQQAIDDPLNEIDKFSVRRWSRDVVADRPDSEIAEMLVRHYSLNGDAVHFFNWDVNVHQGSGRNVTRHSTRLWPKKDEFWDGSFFSRYLTTSDRQRSSSVTNLGDAVMQVYCGNSASLLQHWPAESFDGAVTSPPYYNARDYSQWANIYCYLHDMHAVNREVYRTLKTGSYYLYNLFDYFDNERSVVFSLMGQKRMILSAYTVDMFRRIGFELLGNIAWDKGDIEGKRGFNAGNFSPYYQSPFNCWEHVLVFRKPIREAHSRDAYIHTSGIEVNTVRRVPPVIKMVAGRNIHGHTAPFPDDIPALLLNSLDEGATVLDPFAGSLTTGRVAVRRGLRAVCIEQQSQYCELGLRLWREEQARERQSELFAC